MLYVADNSCSLSVSLSVSLSLSLWLSLGSLALWLSALSCGGGSGAQAVFQRPAPSDDGGKAVVAVGGGVGGCAHGRSCGAQRYRRIEACLDVDKAPYAPPPLVPAARESFAGSRTNIPPKEFVPLRVQTRT